MSTMGSLDSMVTLNTMNDVMKTTMNGLMKDLGLCIMLQSLKHLIDCNYGLQLWNEYYGFS